MTAPSKFREETEDENIAAAHQLSIKIHDEPDSARGAPMRSMQVRFEILHVWRICFTLNRHPRLSHCTKISQTAYSLVYKSSVP